MRYRIDQGYRIYNLQLVSSKIICCNPLSALDLFQCSEMPDASEIAIDYR